MTSKERKLQAALRTPRVLSIQSHVVHGYCGNRAAVFCLQILGFEVDFINSVQLSNHTEYSGSYRGQVVKSDELAELVQGLSDNDLDHYDYVVTGYVGDVSFLKQIAETIKYLKVKNPNLIYLCDPVLGDDDHLYVPQPLVGLYRDLIVPLADIVTPNQFELEQLLDVKLKTQEDALSAINSIHAVGPKTVLLTSTYFGEPTNTVIGFVSSASLSHGAGDSARVACKFSVPKVAARFTGTGDVFAATFLAWYHRDGFSVRLALEKALCGLRHLLRLTYAVADAKGQWNCGGLELKLIESQKRIQDPKIPHLDVTVTDI